MRLLIAPALLLLLWAAAAVMLDRHGARRSTIGSHDTIAVLGCRVLEDGTASGALARRTKTAVGLWEEGRAPRIALTGGARPGLPSEASVAAKLARSLSVPEEALILEEHSTSTEENASELADVLGDVSILVVTDGYHVFRTERVFRRHFSQVRVVGSQPGQRLRVRGALREVLAVGAYSVRGLMGGS